MDRAILEWQVWPSSAGTALPQPAWQTNHIAKCKQKNRGMIEGLVKKGDKEGLKNMSQQLIWKTWYKVSFGSNNTSKNWYDQL